MLRRRRTCNPQELSLSLGSFVRDSNADETRKKKRKLSPFPEVRGMEEENAPNQQQPVKQQPVFIKPSEVVLMEQKMARAKFPDNLPKTEGGEEDSTLWSSVVSWMKSAVEFIGLEATPTATGGASTSTRPRKRPLADSNAIDEGPNVIRPRKKGRRMSLGPGVMERQNKFKGRFKEQQLFEGVGLELLTTPTRTELDDVSTKNTKFCSTKSLLNSAHKYESEGKGLNTLNSTLSSVRIRNPSLRKYYEEGNTPHPLRRSPRLAAKQEGQSSLVPPPPPPPPPPSIPPPPPPISLRNATPINNNSPSSISRSTLRQMQNRLRDRMMKKGSSNLEENKATASTVKINVKARQWAELQAHKRKMSLEKFIVLVEEKKREIGIMLEELQSRMPSDISDMRHIVDEVQDASQWFSGGSREMKEEFPMYKSLERKIELMTECVQIQSDMTEVLSDNNPLHQRSSFSSPHTHLDQLRGEFLQRHKQWGQVLGSDAKTWVDSALPVDHALLRSAKSYLVGVVTRYTDLAGKESDKVGGVMCSIKSRRVTQVKNDLKEGLGLVKELLSYCPNGLDSSPCCGMGSGTGIGMSPATGIGTSPATGSGIGISPGCCNCVTGSVARAFGLCERYVNVCLMEYDGHVGCLKRQEVCEHFETVLKVLSSIKGMVAAFPELSKKTKKSGLLSVWSSSDKLSSSLYTSCVKLIRHIESQSRLIMESGEPSNARSSREIVLWMMFGCKYVNSILEVIGSKQADERGVKDLLQQLQQMESLLPE